MRSRHFFAGERRRRRSSSLSGMSSSGGTGRGRWCSRGGNGPKLVSVVPHSCLSDAADALFLTGNKDFKYLAVSLSAVSAHPSLIFSLFLHQINLGGQIRWLSPSKEPRIRLRRATWWR